MIKDMSEKTIWKIQYINLCISAFARKYKMQPHISFRYLNQYAGLDFLDRNYEAEHILPLEDTLNSLQQICHRNGGTI
ncbi:MAG: DUF3791 domain-containing protein [Paludibacteraceae bacterium]|nr:DUF3791 domain-containing protein [Paludibacteraceae bacterium]